MASFKHRIEYQILRGLIGLFRLLPHRAALGSAAGLAWIVHRGFGWRKREAWRRIREVLPSSSDAEVRTAAWISFRNLWFNAVELIRAGKLSDSHWQRHLDNQDVVRSLRTELAGGKGLIVALVHAGNWDLAGVWTSRHGIPGIFIARSQKNPLVNGLMNQFREMTGALVVDRDDPHLVRKVVRALKEGRMLAILIDLRARTAGLNLPYLGGRAEVGAGLAAIAQLSGAPVLPVFLRRSGWQNHGWECGRAVRFEAGRDKEEERARIMRECLDWLGQRVLSEPSQYFWYNKRWVLEPFPPVAVGDPGARTGTGEALP